MNSYVKIKVTGKNIKLFLKRYIINKISYKEYKNISYKEVSLKISYEDYLNLLSKKNIYKIEVIKFYGLIKYVYFIKHNLSFLVSLSISIIFLFIISNVVFKIDVIHNEDSIRNLIKEELTDKGIKTYSLVPNFNKRKKIIEEIIKDNKDKIEWMEIERKGSRLIVKVTERKLNKKKEDNNSRHIVAKKDGIIMKIEADTGVILKKVNDYVKKGDIIISGDIIKDETVKGQVKAKGLVYAETWYKVNVEYPLYYEETIYLEDVKNNFILSFLSGEYPLKKNYAKSYLEKKKVFIKDKVFPFSISMEKQRKIKVKKQELSYEEVVDKALAIALKKVNAKLNSDEYVISKKTLNFREKESKIIVDIFFKVCENITDYKETDPSLLNNKENE